MRRKMTSLEVLTSKYMLGISRIRSLVARMPIKVFKVHQRQGKALAQWFLVIVTLTRLLFQVEAVALHLKAIKTSTLWRVVVKGLTKNEVGKSKDQLRPIQHGIAWLFASCTLSSLRRTAILILKKTKKTTLTGSCKKTAKRNPPNSCFQRSRLLLRTSQTFSHTREVT